MKNEKPNASVISFGAGHHDTPQEYEMLEQPVQARFNVLNSEVLYYFTVDAVNDNGVTPKKTFSFEALIESNITT